jgi:CTP synthase
MDHHDAYKSLFEALYHAANSIGVELQIKSFESDRIVDGEPIENIVGSCDGYVVPGGFGGRGWEGKIKIAEHCRIHKIPYFGICLGMQVMIVEFARNVLHLKKAHSTEVDLHTPDPVISMLHEQKNLENLGGTMRLGAYPCRLSTSSLAYKAYQQELISERHRHRYEVNNRYKERFEKEGILFSGILENGSLCEISEVKDHPWMLGVQFHPEFKSKPLAPHPLFIAFLNATKKNG